mmetsp:Transcript_53974/g.128579  ORF Transcript_53974/g.128579 Transcript_53974/m.128579 type:complete len:241 (-) Transcript_53974:156-878(-)
MALVLSEGGNVCPLTPVGLQLEVLHPFSIKERRYAAVTTTFLDRGDGAGNQSEVSAEDSVPTTWKVQVGLQLRRASSCPGFLQDDYVEEQQPPQQGSALPTTLQIHSLHPDLSLWTLVQFLDNANFSGQYNYVHIPRSTDGMSRQYAFVNFVSAAAAQAFLQAWDYREAPGVSRPNIFLRCKLASDQGYKHYTSEKNLKLIRRIRNRDLWPLIATHNGQRLLMAPWFGIHSRIRNLVLVP